MLLLLYIILVMLSATMITCIESQPKSRIASTKVLSTGATPVSVSACAGADILVRMVMLIPIV